MRRAGATSTTSSSSPPSEFYLPPVCHALGGGVTPWRCIDCSSVSLPKMLLMPAVVTLDLDAGCLRQKIHGARDFPWTTQPQYHKMRVISLQQPLRGFAAPPLPRAPRPPDRVAGV